MTGPALGTVAELWRYPVKSMAGEQVESVDVEPRGVVGDRVWAVRDLDGKLGSGKSSRRFRKMVGLALLRASYDGKAALVSFPDGRSFRPGDPALDQAVSSIVGRPVTVAREGVVSHFDDAPLHLLTTASLAWVGEAHGSTVDVRRARPNLLLDVSGEGLVEESWVGQRFRIGETCLVEVIEPTPRCVMLDQAQAGLEQDSLLATVTRTNDMFLGVQALVVNPGRIRRGDPVVALWVE